MMRGLGTFACSAETSVGEWIWRSPATHLSFADKSLSWQTTMEKQWEMFQDADLDGNRKIEFDEFSALVTYH